MRKVGKPLSLWINQVLLTLVVAIVLVGTLWMHVISGLRAFTILAVSTTVIVGIQRRSPWGRWCLLVVLGYACANSVHDLLLNGAVTEDPNPIEFRIESQHKAGAMAGTVFFVLTLTALALRGVFGAPAKAYFRK